MSLPKAETTGDTHWEPADAASPPDLGENEVHVWRISLDDPHRPHAELTAWLDDEERARAARLHFATDRRRFEAGRGLLRSLLAPYAGASPPDLAFLRGARGKPRLAGTDLAFNLSHSGEWALLAVTRGRDIGVDIERVREVPEFEDIARNTFARAEQDELFGLPAARRQAGFLACWTRKEAYVKAIGDGLYAPLDAFVVSVDPDAPAQLVSIRESPASRDQWTLCSLRPTNDTWAAVAVHAGGVRLRTLTPEPGGTRLTRRR
jgi:4'-phosphopantetheinyl transferase